MLATHCGCIKDLPQRFYHNPTITDKVGWTVAMYSAWNGIIKDLPREFYHYPLMTCEDGWTVAMYAAVNECI